MTGTRPSGTDISTSGADLERAMGGASSDGLGWEAERDGHDGWREERGGMMIFNGGSGCREEADGEGEGARDNGGTDGVAAMAES